MSRTVGTWGRFVGSALVFTVLVWRLGTSPFLVGLRTVNGATLAAAAGLALLTAVCCAWRWKTVARGLGLGLSLTAAVTAYHRSLFLSVTLPGGVVGDVHRGISHCRDVHDVGRALRSVAWERFAGQVVQVLLTVVVLLWLPSLVQGYMPWVAIAVVVTVPGILLLARARTGGSRSAWARLRRAAACDLRDGLFARRAWPGVAIAWTFGAAGLGAQAGVATAVVYGVMVLVASLPRAVGLIVAWFRRNRPTERIQPPLREQPAHA